MSKVIEIHKRKIEIVQVRLTMDEKADWKILAELNGFKCLSDYLRSLVEKDMKCKKFIS